MNGEDFLEVDPSLHITRHIHFLVKGLATHLVAVEVTTREKNKFTLKDAQVLKENVRSVHCLSKRKTRINLFLSNTGQFSAERCKFRVDCWLYIGLELSNYLFLLDVDDYHREFNDLVKCQILCLIFTLALEIVNNNKVKRSLIDKFSIFDI